MENSEIIGAGQDTARRAPKTNTITCGDCLEVMQAIPDKSVDMILCDLPYGTTACKWDVIIPVDLLWNQYNRISTGVIVLFGAEPFASTLRLSNTKKYKYDLIWNKGWSGKFGIVKYRPFPQHENIIVFNKGNYNSVMKVGKPYFEKAKTVPQKYGNPHKYGVSGNLETTNTGSRYPGSILEFNCQMMECNNTKRVHPTQKPVALFEYLIRTYSNEGDTVLDNCIGSGTTAIACINTGRNYIGIEKEDKYCRIAEERIHALRSPAQNTMEICHTAPNSASPKAAQVTMELGL